MEQGQIKNFISNSKGFTLMEVMIAIAIFAVFATAFVTGFGFNMVDSSKLKENILLKDLAENKINEIISNPPTFSAALTLTKESKDIPNYTDYQTIVEYKKIFVPDMAKITSKSTGEEGASKEEESPQAQLEKRIFSVFKENMEKMLWQVEVTVKNKNSGEFFKLNAWLYNHNAEVKIGTF